MNLSAIDQRVRQSLHHFLLVVEAVSDLVFADDGVTAQGAGGHELTPELGGLYGLQTRPPDGACGVVVKVGGEGDVAHLVAYRHRDHEAQLAKGEVRMHDDRDQEVWIHRDSLELHSGGATIEMDRVTGTITLSPAPGAKVVLAGGGLAVARQSDTVQVTIPPGTVGVGNPLNAAPIVVSGTITSGDPNVEA